MHSQLHQTGASRRSSRDAYGILVFNPMSTVCKVINCKDIKLLLSLHLVCKVRNLSLQRESGRDAGRAGRKDYVVHPRW